jgi:serine protease Do
MVVAIGNPLGDELASTMTVGYVSGKDRSISTDGTIINMLQTDAAINSGNSGGPLFNMKGEVIGITSAKYSGSSSSGASIEGIGFAIPINDVMGMIDDFMNYGYLRNQAYLGVSVMDMDASTARMYSLPTGSYVQEVVEGGSAHRAGVLPQDIIIAIGEYSISGNSSLTTTLRRFSAGDTTTITVYRAGAEITLDITFDERPQDLNAQSTQPLDPGEMPDTGSYDEWYEYFSRYFGSQGNQP